jgi:hypothetical protein
VTTSATAAAAVTPQPAPPLPTLQLGRHVLTRLICGANCFNAGSHLSVFVNHEMRRYFTPEQVLKTLRRCQEVGINCWQSAGGNVAWHRRFRDEGGQLHYLSLGEEHYQGGTPPLSALAAAGCIGVAHHGEVTDQHFKAGPAAFAKVRDYLKKVHDAGMLAGVSTHMPAVVDAIEAQGWELDFYMTCVYERHRTAEELRKLLGHVPIPVGEVYLESDPPRMLAAVRAARRPCLAFKILAAGRLSERREYVEQAFRDTFAGLKPGDGMIVGMYDKFADQPAENAELTRRYGAKRD